MRPDRTRTGSAALSNKRVRERMVENVRETQKRNTTYEYTYCRFIVMACRAGLPCWPVELLCRPGHMMDLVGRLGLLGLSWVFGAILGAF